MKMTQDDRRGTWLGPMALVFWAMAIPFMTLSPWFAGPAQAQAVVFNRIDVTGNQRIEADTIRVFSGLTPGQPATEFQLNAAVQRLFDTGLFEDVQITPRGGVLQIAVAENPTINQIAFEGNRRIDDEVLGGVITLAPRQPYSRSAAEEDAAAILQVYARSGRFGARVEPKLIRLPDNRVNLVYEVREGRVTEVQRIAFVGNETYSDRRLRRVIATGQAGLFARFFTNDVYDPDRLELDKQNLRRFYLERGFVDFEIESAAAEISREQNAFFLTFRLDEGPRYSLGELTVNATAPGIDAAEYRALIDMRPGETYNVKRVERVVERMAFLAGQQGFAFVEVVPRVSPQPDMTVDIQFDLLEGPKVFIERIDVRGNRETVDRVIRRQFRVVEGDAFNAGEVRRAEQRIRALGFFETVAVRVREGSSPDRAVIVVDVEEAPTGNLGFGAAFSSSDGLTGTISLSERNFLGRGQAVSLELAGGADTTTVAFSFEEPALFDQDLSAGLSIFYREQDLDTSGVRTTTYGIVPSLGFPVSEDARLTLRLRAASEEIQPLSGATISPIIDRETGTRETLGVGFTYVLDKRNSPVDPTAGFLLRFEQDFAGLAGAAQYSKSEVTGRVYTSILDEEVILSAELAGGALLSFDDSSRLTERFLLGGDAFRGFDYGGLGPRDRCTGCGPGGEDLDTALGGNLYAIARLEATFPIGLPPEYGIYGGVFADAGTLWSLYDTAGASGTVDDTAKLRSAVGVSLFWDTAIGPLRFNLAEPLVYEDGDRFERFRITVDTRF